jgi:hypothetical protein
MLVESPVAIAPCDVTFHPLSYGDPQGRVFEWEGQLYRGIRPAANALYQRLVDDGTFKRLAGQGLLIETAKAHIAVKEFDLVLKHRRVPFISYAYEWSAAMLRDAALLVVDLNLELARSGLATQDAHPANVLFDRCRAVFVDVGSIVPVPPHRPWVAEEEFRRFYLYPLYLMAQGQGRIARWLLHDTEGGVLPTDFYRGGRSIVPSRASAVRAVGYQVRGWMKALYPKVVSQVPPSIRRPLKQAVQALDRTRETAATASAQVSRVRALKRLREEIASIRLPSPTSAWSGYYDRAFPPFSPSEAWSPKHHSVGSLLTRLRPSTVLDIGSNQGWYAELATTVGGAVTAVDTDEACVTALYERGKTKRLDVLPLVMDVRYPSPGSGIANECFSPATQRLSCELVLALALVHHLVFHQNMTLEKVVRALEVFVKRWLVVEFISKDDPYVRNDWSPERHPWYRLEEFQRVLAARFARVERLPSDAPTRTLFVCEGLHASRDRGAVNGEER